MVTRTEVSPSQWALNGTKAELIVSWLGCHSSWDRLVDESTAESQCWEPVNKSPVHISAREPGLSGPWAGGAL